LPTTVLALGVTSFFTDVATEMVFPLLPAFLLTLGAGPTFLGLIEGVADAVAAGLKYVVGRRSDQVRELGARRRFVFVGYGLATVVRPLLALAAAPWHVLLIRVMDRVGKGVRSAPRDALLADSVAAADSGRAFGFHQAMDHAGAVVGPLLATALFALGVEVRTIFAVTLVPGVLAVVAIAFAREPERRLATLAVSGAVPPLGPELRRLLGLLFFFSLSNSSDVFLLVRMQELGLATTWLPLAWLSLNFAKMFWSARGGVLADRVPKQRLLLTAWALYAACYLALAAVTVIWQAWLVLVVYGAFAGLSEPVEKALVKELSGDQQRGSAFGAYHGLLGAAAIPAGLLTGMLWQTYGAGVALSVGAAGAAVSAVGLLVWGPSRLSSRNPKQAEK
jgi:MFS family permease